jgi:hypothetical protein
MAYFRTIAEFVVLAAPMVVAGCGNPVDCHSHPMTDVTIPVTALPDPTDGGSADGGTQELVDGCQTTRSDCLTTGDGGLALHIVYSGYCAV